MVLGIRVGDKEGVGTEVVELKERLGVGSRGRQGQGGEEKSEKSRSRATHFG